MNTDDEVIKQEDIMKFGIACDVDSKLHLDNGMTIEAERFTYIFYITEEGFLKQVRIISTVDDPEKYFYRKTPMRADGTFDATPGFEPHIQEGLIREMQRIESALALVGNLKRIHWEKATMEYYAETEAEHSRLDIMPAWFFIREMNLNFPTHLETPTLLQLVKGKDATEPLVVPMSFYREGKAEFSAGRYINAYINFYLVIEGLFANGKWDKNGVIRELSNSEPFTAIVQSIMNDTGNNHDLNEGTTREQLEAELNTRAQPFTTEGLIKLLVKKRGDLHHFSRSSTRPQGTPFNHMEYKTITFVLFRIASDSLIYWLTEEEKRQSKP